MMATTCIIACNNSSDKKANESEDTTPLEVENSAEDRRLNLLEKADKGTLSLGEQAELDSLEVEKYKQELKEDVLQMVEEKENHE